MIIIQLCTAENSYLILFSPLLLFFSPFYEGISLSNEVCNLMAIRYGDPDLKIRFESFVCFMLRVEIMGGEIGATWLARLPS